MCDSIPVSQTAVKLTFVSHVAIGTLFRASQFLSEELPIRLAHRVQDLGQLPDGLSEMPSIKKVQDWYAQSFEVWTPPPCDSYKANAYGIGNHHPSPSDVDARSQSPSAPAW